MTALRASTRLPAALVFALPLLAGACGDSDRPAYVISVGSDDATPVNELDEPQLRQVCGSFASYVETEISFDAVTQAVCLVTSQLATLTPEACDAAYTECLETTPDPVSFRAELETGTLCTNTLSQCNASVDAVEGCLNLQLDTLEEILDLLACSDASEDAREMADDLMTGVSACADLDAQCTEFAGPVDLL